MDRTTVLLLFGGESSEHEVSISSARNVYAAIDDSKYTVLLGYIDRQGKWWLLDSFGEQIVTHGAPQLMPALGAKSFVTMPESRIVKPDVILPILHGRNGEDGSVQGLAQLLHIPMVGCDITASALCMDKVATKQLLRASNISVVPYEKHFMGDELPDFNKLSMKLGSPLFVKPARAGSSVGVSKVYSEDELEQALGEAHRHSNVVLIEAGITGHELEVAVLGNPPYHQASVVGEIEPDGDFYSYDAKYAASSRSKVTIPAQIEPEHAKAIRDIALKAYEILGCQGLSRVDFFLQDDGTIFVNEINTLPGFTNISMYPKLWREEGISYPELIERFISLALDGTIKPADKREE
jgi:D-alanine-D-alanine ligase